MTQEDKELLLRDLCARLPYYPICEYEWKKIPPNGTSGYVGELSTYTFEQFQICDEYEDVPIKSIRPYLRPMSSMTKEERQEYGLVLCDELSINQYDWLNAHHFDYRGLIDKGLALEASEGMYN